MSDGSSILAFLTGQSDPATNALSAAQQDFMNRAAGLGTGLRSEMLPLNFPYLPSVPSPRPPALWRASVSNSLQYLRSRRPSFAETYRDGFLKTFEGYDQVMLLAGSCGLELLVNLRLPDSFLARTHVFAYGPVSRSLPRCATLWLVQGDRDSISKWWHREPCHRIACGHMGYFASPELMELFQRFHESVTATRHAQD